MAKQELNKYSWVFSHNKKGFLTSFQANGQGDMDIDQISPWIMNRNKAKENSIHTGINFEQHSERILLIAFLNYAKESLRDLSYLKEESGLLLKVKKLPDMAGNFSESESLINCSDSELEKGLQEDLIWFNMKTDGLYLGSHGHAEIDRYKNLLLIGEYLDGQDAPPVIIPPTQISKAIFGLFHLASYGGVRTAKREMIERLNYWRTHL